MFLWVLGSDGRDGKEAASTTEELELELEALDIADEPLELEAAEEAESEELAKKILDEQGQSKPHGGRIDDGGVVVGVVVVGVVVGVVVVVLVVVQVLVVVVVLLVVVGV